MYEIMVSADGSVEAVFPCDHKRHAKLLYQMAVNSGMFDYVTLSEIERREVMLEDWVDDEEVML